MDTGKEIRISITSGTIIKAIVIALIFSLLYFFRDLVVVILTAIIIASAIEAPIKYLVRFRIPRTIAVIVVYLIAASVVAGLFYYFLPVFLTELNVLLSSLPKYIESISVWNPLGKEAFTEAVPVVESLQIGKSFSFGDTISGINSVLSGTSEGLLRLVSAVFGGILSLILIVVLSFYFAVQDDGVSKFLRIVLPAKYENYVIDLWKRGQDKIGKWLQGQLLLAVLIGVLVYLGLTIFQVKNAFLLAVVAAAFEIIPVFGPILSAIPAVAISLMSNGVTLSLIVAGYYILINQFENHVIYPLVVRKIVGIPPILVIIALIVGYELAGLIGVIIAVPMAAVLVEFLDDVQKRKNVLQTKVARSES